MPFSVHVAEHVHVFFQELNPSYDLPAGTSSRMYHHFLLALSAAFYSRCVQSPPHPLPAPSLLVAYPRLLQVQAPRYGRGQKHRRETTCCQASTVRARCSDAPRCLELQVKVSCLDVIRADTPKTSYGCLRDL
jgi:hypothetical protein